MRISRSEEDFIENFQSAQLESVKGFSDDTMYIEKYIENEESLAPEKRIEIEKLKNEIDIDFLKDDIKELIRSCVEGTERTKNIILDLKNLKFFLLLLHIVYVWDCFCLVLQLVHLHFQFPL